MKGSEIREKSAEELQTTLIELLKDQFTYRMQKSTGQLNQTHLLGAVSRDIARVRTVMAENERAAK